MDQNERLHDSYKTSHIGLLKSSNKTKNNQLDSGELRYLESVVEPKLNISYWIKLELDRFFSKLG